VRTLDSCCRETGEGGEGLFKSQGNKFRTRGTKVQSRASDPLKSYQGSAVKKGEDRELQDVQMEFFSSILMRSDNLARMGKTGGVEEDLISTGWRLE